MKNALRTSTRATRPATPVVPITNATTFRPEHAPHFVALEHRAIAATRLAGRELDHAEWIVERVRESGEDAPHGGYGIRLSLAFGDGDGKRDDVRVIIASDTDGAVPSLTPEHFRRLVAALNAAAAALPELS